MARKALPHRMCDQRVPMAEPILKMPQAPAGQVSQPAPLGTLRASKVPRKAGTARNPPWMASRSDKAAQIKPLR